jgi:DNA polymerase III epsilon subunit-like protein
MALLRFSPKQKFLTFDFETEGLSLFYSRPLQLSWLDCDFESIKSVREHIIDIEDMNISEGAARVTRFDRNKYDRTKKPAGPIWEEFAQYLYDDQYYLVGHNILGFDAYMIQNLTRYVGKREDWSFVPRMIDTLCLARGIHYGLKPPKRGTEDFMLWQYKLLQKRETKVKCTLGALCKYYQIATDESMLHDAVYDIRQNLEVFKKQIWEIEI